MMNTELPLGFPPLEEERLSKLESRWAGGVLLPGDAQPLLVAPDPNHTLPDLPMFQTSSLTNAGLATSWSCQALLSHRQVLPAPLSRSTPSGNPIAHHSKHLTSISGISIQTAVSQAHLDHCNNV